MSTQIVDDKVSAALFGKTRRAVLALLYSRHEESFHIRHILRIVNAGHGAVQRELKQLADAGIISRTVRGRQVYYQANPESPIFRELKGLVTWLGRDQTQLIGSNVETCALTERFRVPQRRLAEFCRKHHIKKLSLFGSVLREDFRPDSDIDVLVEFEEGYVPGFGIVDVEDELCGLAGRKVDLRTPGDLSRHFRDQVVREANVCYAAA